MEEELEVSQEYLKGFNDGYQLRKHEPELLDKILKSTSTATNERIKAMEAGSRQAQKEKIIEQMKEKEAKAKEQSKGKERER